MGPQEDFVETVFTCEGDINDPDLKNRLEDFRSTLRDLLSTDKRKLILKKVEPWNSVRVTFNIPLEAARRLKHLAQQGDATLKQLGVLAVQLEGDQLISLTIAGRNNERTKLIFKTTGDSVSGASAVINKGPSSGQAVDFNGPGTSEATRKNIADYLKQGSQLLGLLPPQLDNKRNAGQDIFGAENPTSKTPIPIGPNPSPKNGPQIVPEQKRLLPTNMEHPEFPMFLDNYMNLPPPPPYPGIPATSPLLVNLLQTDAMANFMNSKMLPPSDTSPPPKKKRKPRKPKEKNKTATVTQSEMDLASQSIPNPALGHCGLPTSGNSSNMPSMLITQALPPSSMPVVTCSALPERAMPSVPAKSDFHPNMRAGVNPQMKEFMLAKRMHHKQGHPENSSGKIINPYTGILEPVESSDSSPCKSDSSMDSFSPMKKVSPKDKKTVGLAMCTSSIVNSVPSAIPSADRVRIVQGSGLNSVGFSSSLHIQSDSAGYPFLTSANPAALVHPGITTTAALSASSLHVSTSHTAVVSESRITSRTSVMQATKSSENGAPGLNKHSKSVNSLHESKLSETSIHEHLQEVKETSILTSVASANTDPLLNISHPNPAKNPHLGSQLDSPGADSENSNNGGMLHDSNMQNELGAANTVCHLEGKAYNHDSGVGSSSERSDDTPSEPGDDLKLVHSVVEENIKVSDALLKVSASKVVTQSKLVTENSSQGLEKTNKIVNSSESLKVQSTLHKNVNMDLTVGYAMSNSLENKLQSDISAMMTMDKVLSHFNDKNVYNHIGKNQTNTVLHWSTTDKFISNQMETKKHPVPKSHTSSETHKHLPAHLFPKQHTNQHNKVKRKVEHPFNPQAHFFADIEGSYHPMVSSNANEAVLPGNTVNAVSAFSSSSSSVSQLPVPNYSKQCDIGNSAVSKVLCNSDLHSSIQYSSGLDSNNSLNSVMSKDLQMQRKYSKSPQELKGKSSSSSTANSVPHQMDTTVSTFTVGNSVVEKRLGDVSQGNLEGSVAATTLTSKTVHSSDSSRNVTNMYRRRSPTGPGTSSHQQHFLNPGLPLAKSLTESVQKVVKALPSIENSTLPHQRKSPVNSSCKVSCSSSPSKPVKISESRNSSGLDSLTIKQTIPLSSATVISETDLSNPGDLVNSLHGFNEHSASSQGIEKLLQLQNSAPLPVLEIESSHELEFSSVPAENHLGVEIDCKQNFHDTKSQSLLDKSKPSLQDSSIKDEKASSKVENCDRQFELQICEQSKQRLQPTDSLDKNISKSVPMKRDTSSSTPISEPAAIESQQETPNPGHSEKDKIKVETKEEKLKVETSVKMNHLQVKPDDTKQVDDTNPGSSRNTDTKQSPKSSSKSSKGSGDAIFKSKRLELEEKNMEVTVVTKVKPSEQRQQDKSEPTVPPIIIRVRKSAESSDASKGIPEVLAANPEESHLSMTLRGKSTSKSPEEPVHNLRHSKVTKQSVVEQSESKSDKNTEKDSNKNVISDDESLKRNLRRRKCVTNDGEPEAKKALIENEDVAKHTRSSDLKESNTAVTSKKTEAPVLQKMDTSKGEEETDTSSVVDGVKSGLRARSNAKSVEEKQKSSGVKEVKKFKAEDENFIKNKQVSRQKKLSPTVPTEKTPASAIREKSPLRGSRTRGQTLPNTEEDLNKRSTRSAKTKGEIKENGEAYFTAPQLK
ncbi:uncharacterized protein LOC134255243 isoform X2 [Saccostrea cucullata]|uniref:uncharacterized protein LOC134255243 isoform X2 n=1 Tax=Saccostrea cuccullata TaxID=36930 RepID=UPI002ED1A9CB